MKQDRFLVICFSTLNHAETFDRITTDLTKASDPKWLFSKHCPHTNQVEQ